MADTAETNRRSDDGSEGTAFTELVDAPVAALGLPNSAADALEQALGVKTVRDFAENRYVRRAQAIMNLAKTKK